MQNLTLKRFLVTAIDFDGLFHADHDVQKNFETSLFWGGSRPLEVIYAEFLNPFYKNYISA
jgi:hypothetical protein